MKYWIYESWSHNKAIVHNGSCEFCQNGTHRQGEKNTRNGSWTGPYATPAIAMSAAIKTRRQIIRGCNYCMNATPAVMAA